MHVSAREPKVNLSVRLRLRTAGTDALANALSGALGFHAGDRRLNRAARRPGLRLPEGAWL